MIFRLIQRVKNLLQTDSTLSEFQQIKEVDDIETYDDFITKFPAIGIGRKRGEIIRYRGDTREVQQVLTPLDIRVYTRHESSPEAARKVLDILTWKVVNALRKNTQLEFSSFDPAVFLIESEVNRVWYGSRKRDKAFDEYATIEYNTVRPEVEPETDEEYWDIVNTMIRVSMTGLGGGYEER